MTTRALTRKQRLAIAFTADCDLRTVEKMLAGRPVHSAIAKAIREAIRKLKLEVDLSAAEG